MADRYPYPGLGGHAPGESFELGAEIARHIAQVLRASPGQRIVLFDGSGREGDVSILRIDKRRLGVQLEELRDCPRQASCRLELAFSPPKGSRAETLVEQATALGCRAFQPLIYERTPKAQRWTKVPARLERVAWAVAGQCGLDRVPEFREPCTLGEYLRQAGQEGAGRRFLAEPQPETASAALGNPSEDALVIVGPEGDFTPSERESIHAAGCRSLDLGPFVLRIETAAIAAAARLLLPWPGR
ncbi:MAG: hypothetical protein CSA62_04930 [Planctomycetota bacterium]|nr:MAG: hypothetical protein CSA62_04930 [Planctomycetota bacterium]